jgi:aspartyl-tRNA(Asn)/glutamyl-tRNA(Gln) amidotransferase subunit C
LQALKRTLFIGDFNHFLSIFVQVIMSVTAKDVAYIADLAKLRFTEEETIVMTSELNNILHYIDKLNEVDTEGVEPLSSIHDQTNVLREDVELPALSTDEVLKNAPDRQDRFFKVPKVIG